LVSPAPLARACSALHERCTGGRQADVGYARIAEIAAAPRTAAQKVPIATYIQNPIRSERFMPPWWSWQPSPVWGVPDSRRYDVALSTGDWGSTLDLMRLSSWS
jgi:hypothetical protein